MGYTPGSWYRSGYCKLDNCYHIGTLGKKGCTGIAIDKKHSMKEVVADVWANDDHGLADARLIAAAPDLLEACKALLVMMNRGASPRKFNEALSWRENDLKARGMALAAITKAEGDT